MTMTMTQERVALTKYLKLLQVIELRLLEKGVKDGQVQVSYFDFDEEPIESLDTGIALLGRLENEGGIKVTARPERDYMNTYDDNYFTIEVLPRFWKILEAIGGKIGNNSDEPVGVYYEKEAGIGYARKRFKFKRGSDTYKVFPELYERVGIPVPQERVKELLDFAGTGYYERANGTAKAIRRATDLTADELVLNNGSLTLIGKKLDKPPT